MTVVTAQSPSFAENGWKATIDGRTCDFRSIQEMAAAESRLSTIYEILDRLGFHATRIQSSVQMVCDHVVALERREGMSAVRDVERRLNALGIMSEANPVAIVEAVGQHMRSVRKEARDVADGTIWTDIANRIFPPGTAVEFESSLGVPKGTTLRRVVASKPKICGNDDVCVDLEDDSAWVPVRLLRPASVSPTERECAELVELRILLKRRDAEIEALRSEAASGPASRADLRHLKDDLCKPIRALNHRIEELEKKVGSDG